MKAAYRNTIDRRYCTDEANRIRWRKTMRFIEGSPPSVAEVSSALDLGDRTPLCDDLERHFGCPFASTGCDLDVDTLSGSYDVVTAFEVLEHLYNPLHALLEVRKALAGPHARLFVSVPAAKPAMLKSPDHFHEMSPSELDSLFARAGFSVIRSGRFRIRHWPFYLTGFKPFLRAFYEKVLIYELRPA
ncbi:MAG: class I SAM-dependent methyltransferase [Chlorobi bacterium]|nr:class I SAM-dependent methyltransferase [Chlorobiota bacterium]